MFLLDTVYVSLLYRFRYSATSLLKIANFSIPTVECDQVGISERCLVQRQEMCTEHRAKAVYASDWMQKFN